MQQILITIASVLFFSNKTLLLLGKSINKRIGWLLGAAAAVLFIIYFFLIGTPILSVLEIGLTILMTYRFIARDKTNKNIEKLLGVITGIFILTLTILARAGTLSIAQFFGAFGMLVGTYFLISAKQIQIETANWQERTGWLLYGFGHFFTSYIGYQKHEWIFFVFQVWQMLLCLVGAFLFDLKERRIVTRTSLAFGATGAALFLIVISNYY